MYIQVTNRCNMKCQHCIYDCTSQGEDMSWTSFHYATMMAMEYHEFITIGGGEPTMWKEFPRAIEFMRSAILSYGGRSWDGSFFMVTNGTRKRNTFAAIELMDDLEDMGIKDRFRVVLSAHDGFHDDDKIHPDVLSYFERKQSRISRGRPGAEAIRSVSRLIPAGRALKNAHILSSYFQHYDECACTDLFVRPNGDIHACGCVDSPKIGVANGLQCLNHLNLENHRYGECWKSTQGKEDENESAESKVECCEVQSETA